MNNYKDFFKGKKITVMGLGLLGRGLGDVKFLAECGADLIVTDLKSEKELEASVSQLKNYKNIRYVLGEHRLEDFRNRDIVLKNAGVPLDSPFVVEARKNGVSVEMDESLFVKLAPKGIVSIGITGTRGKTTVTTLVYEIIKHAFEKTGDTRKVFLAGNIRGVATLPILFEVHARDVIVMELSSWQLQGFGEVGISPHISVFTNFLDDHLNYYKGSRENYFQDKAYIYENQTEEDFLVTSKDVLTIIQNKKKPAKGMPKSKIVVPESLSKTFNVHILGKHNLENIAMAVEVAKILKIDEALIKEAVENFKGVSGRLQLAKTIRGIEIYNDTASTTPDALVVALESLGESIENNDRKKNLILIMGGADKNLDFGIALERIKKYCTVVVLLPGTGTERVKEDIKKLTSSNSLLVVESSTLELAIKDAFTHAKAGDRLVFSPGFASFGMFVNEYDRGDKFNAIIQKIS